MVTVKLKNGQMWEGIFHACSSEGPIPRLFLGCKKKSNNKQQQAVTFLLDLDRVWDHAKGRRGIGHFSHATCGAQPLDPVRDCHMLM